MELSPCGFPNYPAFKPDRLQPEMRSPRYPGCFNESQGELKIGGRVFRRSPVSYDAVYTLRPRPGCKGWVLFEFFVRFSAPVSAALMFIFGERTGCGRLQPVHAAVHAALRGRRSN